MGGVRVGVVALHFESMQTNLEDLWFLVTLLDAPQRPQSGGSSPNGLRESGEKTQKESATSVRTWFSLTWSSITPILVYLPRRGSEQAFSTAIWGEMVKVVRSWAVLANAVVVIAGTRLSASVVIIQLILYLRLLKLKLELGIWSIDK
jgi:hypothetical protein